MPPLINDPVELRERGFEALVQVLGWVNAVRFLQQYERGAGDYTREREALFPDWDVERVLREGRSRGLLPPG